MRWRRKWLIVLPAVLIAVGAAVVIQRLPNLYRSETLILVVPQRVPESYVKSTVTARIEDRLQAISQQILSRTRLEQIVNDFNLYPKERADQELMEDIVERMRTRDIGIDIVKGDAFRVSYSAGDPRVAMRVTERLASLFIDESLRDREVLAEGTSQFLATQLDEARRQLVLNENKLQEYQRAAQRRAAVADERQPAGPAQRRNGAADRSARRSTAIASGGSRSSVRWPTSSKRPTPRPAADGAARQRPTWRRRCEDELRIAQQALLAVELKLKPEHPDVKRLRRDVEELQKRVEAQKLEGDADRRGRRARS